MSFKTFPFSPFLVFTYTSFLHPSFPFYYTVTHPLVGTRKKRSFFLSTHRAQCANIEFIVTFF